MTMQPNTEKQRPEKYAGQTQILAVVTVVGGLGLAAWLAYLGYGGAAAVGTAAIVWPVMTLRDIYRD